MNWYERIERAKRNKGFTQEDRDLAGKWNSCAIGEKFHLTRDKLDELPMVYRGSNAVGSLGWSFQDAVNSDDVPRAKEVWLKIDRLPKVIELETKQE